MSAHVELPFSLCHWPTDTVTYSPPFLRPRVPGAAQLNHLTKPFKCPLYDLGVLRARRLTLLG